MAIDKPFGFVASQEDLRFRRSFEHGVPPSDRSHVVWIIANGLRVRGLDPKDYSFRVWVNELPDRYRDRFTEYVYSHAHNRFYLGVACKKGFRFD